MSCQPIKMADGTVVLANLKPGATLTDEEKQAIAEYVQFCRDRRAKREKCKSTARAIAQRIGGVK